MQSGNLTAVANSICLLSSMLCQKTRKNLTLLAAHVQVGALEYDPDLPEQQRHREFLREKVVFKEVVPIADAALRAKIHQTYRLAYLKDVVLARVLDDATFATFSSLILFNNIEVRLHVTRCHEKIAWPNSCIVVCFFPTSPR